MELVSTAISQEVDKILDEKMPRPFYEWSIYFRIRKPCPIEIAQDDDPRIPADEKENIYRPLKIVNFDISRDYEQNAGDEISISVTMGLGLWYKVLQPCRDYLEAVVTRKPQLEHDRHRDQERQEEVEVYYAIPKVAAIQVGQASSMDRQSRVDLDLIGVIDLEFQLMDLSLEKLRAITVGGIFRKVKPEDVVKGFVAKESNTVKIADDGPAVTAIKMFEADNSEEREHIVIPQGLPLFQVPHYVQRYCGGIYSSGINIYIQNKEIYIFPPYNTKRLDKEDKTLTIIKLPDQAYEEAERTYRLDGDKVIIMAATDSQFDDRGDEDFKSDANGIRFADARKYMHTLVDTEDNKAIAKRGRLNNEFLFKEVKIGDEQNNKVKSSKEAIHANPFFEDSRLTLKEGNFISFNWKNSDASLLYPGMPVKILYLRGQEVRELQGSLLKVFQSNQMQNRGITSSNYQQQSALFVYVEKSIQ